MSGIRERCSAANALEFLPPPPVVCRMVYDDLRGEGRSCGLALAAISGQLPKHRRHLCRLSHSFHGSPSVAEVAGPSNLRGTAFYRSDLGLRLRCGTMGRSCHRRVVPPIMAANARARGEWAASASTSPGCAGAACCSWVGVPWTWSRSGEQTGSITLMAHTRCIAGGSTSPHAAAARGAQLFKMGQCRRRGATTGMFDREGRVCSWGSIATQSVRAMLRGPQKRRRPPV